VGDVAADVSASAAAAIRSARRDAQCVGVADRSDSTAIAVHRRFFGAGGWRGGGADTR